MVEYLGTNCAKAHSLFANAKEIKWFLILILILIPIKDQVGGSGSLLKYLVDVLVSEPRIF